MGKESSTPSSRETLGRVPSTRASRSRVTRIEARRELAVSGEPAGWTDLIKANSAALTFLGITMGVFISRKFFIVPIGLGAMLVQDLLKRSFEGDSRKAGRRRRAA